MRGGRLLATALLGTGLVVATEAQATFTISVQEVGANVVATGSGTIDLTALSFAGVRGDAQAGTNPQFGIFIVGSASAASSADAYGGSTGPTFFGPASFNSFANAGTGDTAGIDLYAGGIFVPVGYVSGTFLSDTATYDNATFSSLGLTPGVYTWTWGSVLNGSADSLVLDIGVPTPEPASLALLGAGLAGIGAIRRRRR